MLRGFLCLFRTETMCKWLRFNSKKASNAGSALDHIELTYHDVIIFKIPDVQVTGFKIFNYYRNGDDTGVDEYDIIDI
jgi:hypothetical protein